MKITLLVRAQLVAVCALCAIGAQGEEYPDNFRGLVDALRSAGCLVTNTVTPLILASPSHQPLKADLFRAIVNVNLFRLLNPDYRYKLPFPEAGERVVVPKRPLHVRVMRAATNLVEIIFENRVVVEMPCVIERWSSRSNSTEHLTANVACTAVINLSTNSVVPSCGFEKTIIVARSFMTASGWKPEAKWDVVLVVPDKDLQVLAVTLVPEGSTCKVFSGEVQSPTRGADKR
jgi:hypothetical protein